MAAGSVPKNAKSGGFGGVSPSVGLGGVDVASPLPEGLIPVVTTPVTGGIAIGLKPGIINIVPVTKTEFEGWSPTSTSRSTDAWVIRSSSDLCTLNRAQRGFVHTNRG